MFLTVLTLVFCAFAQQSLNQEDALQQLKEGNFDIILDVRSLQDFETLRLENAFHLGSLMRDSRGRHRGQRESSSDSSESDDMEIPGRERQINRERPPLEAHVRRLHGCENSRIGVHSMGSSDNGEETFSTAEVAQALASLGFNDVFDLGDVSVAQDHTDISKTSGERTGRCRPECAHQEPPRGRGHHGHGDRSEHMGRPGRGDRSEHGGRPGRGDRSDREGRPGRGRPESERPSEDEQPESREGSSGALTSGRRPPPSSKGRGGGKGKGRGRNDSSSDEVVSSFAKYFGFTFSGFLVLAFLMCLCRRCRQKQVVEEQIPNVDGSNAIGEGSAPTYVVSIDEKAGSIETINGSSENVNPEGWGETTEEFQKPPPSFEDVTQDAKKYAILAE